MTQSELVDKIVDEVDISEYIGNYVDLSPKGKELFGRCPFHQEKTPSFSVTPDRKKFFCFGCGKGGTVLDFVRLYDGITFGEAVEKLSEIIGVNNSEICKSETVDYFKCANRKCYDLPPVRHKILDKGILNKYKKCIYEPWVNEGITEELFEKYGIRIDEVSHRIIYPVYDNSGNLVNIKGRTTFDDFKEKCVPKYINYYQVGVLDYFQCLNFKKNIIEEKQEAIIVEGIKSVMKLESFGYDNAVSSETSGLNDYQIRILLELKCDVVIAFDSDVSFDKILKNISILKRFTNTYIVYDTKNLLGGREKKNSPADMGKEVWDELYKNKIQII